MYTIIYKDGCGMKDIKHICDVRMNIVGQARQGRFVESVWLDGDDVTAEAKRSLPEWVCATY